MAFEKFASRLSDEQKEKIRQCKTLAEVVAFVSSLDFELCDEDLEGIVGGTNWTLEHIDLFKLGLVR